LNRRWLHCGFALCALGSVVAAQEHAVALRVVDTAGKPIPGVTVATGWELDGRVMKPFEEAAKAVSGEDGRARVSFKQASKNVALIGYDSDQTRAGYAIIDTATDEEYRLVLEPVAKLRAKVSITDWAGDYPEGGFNFMILLPEKHAAFAAYAPMKPEVEVPLPAGSYGYFIYSRDTSPFHKERAFKAGEVATLEPIVLEMTPIAKNYGKPALPITVTAARGLEKPFRIEDYRGKWVLLEFWAFW
jgi:hypothetical protein